MAAHAAFNAVVLGVTIASVSGSGHTVEGGGIRAHVPASWHAPAGGMAIEHAKAFVLDGPSGAQIDLLARPTPTAAVEIQLPLGAGERIRVTDGPESADLYVIVSATHSYEFLVDTAGSATAAKQAPAILNSLRED